MRTVLSEEQVARRGRVGCGDVSQAREGDGGVRVDRSVKGDGGEIDDMSCERGKWIGGGVYGLIYR